MAQTSPVRARWRLSWAAALMVVAVFVVGCDRLAPPPLVRDGAGMFSEDARTDAEARLRSIATEHGFWAFVITDPVGDPPRMLDAPMQEADGRGVRAVAVMLSDERLVGTGFSGTAFDGHDPATFVPPDVDSLLAAGENDAALERIVDFLVRWADAPEQGVEPQPDVPQVAPTG